METEVVALVLLAFGARHGATQHCAATLVRVFNPMAAECQWPAKRLELKGAQASHESLQESYRRQRGQLRLHKDQKACAEGVNMTKNQRQG